MLYFDNSTNNVLAGSKAQSQGIVACHTHSVGAFILWVFRIKRDGL